jgi:Tol biopolymer transport system component
VPGGRLVYGRWSPDGAHLFTSNTDGTGEQALLSSTAESPRFSPDGRRLAVSANQGVRFCGVVNLDGSGLMCFASPDPTLTLGCAAWSPDASRLACEGWDERNAARNGIYTVRASDGGGLTRVTANPDGGNDGPGSYSPDGRQIVFARNSLADPEHDTLMVVNVDGSNAHALTDRQVGGARWSPDGKVILTEADGDLLLVAVDGGAITPITFEAGFTVASRAAWSPDGEWIVFTRTFLQQEDIYIVRKDGTNLHQITDTPSQDEEFADWGVAAP